MTTYRMQIYDWKFCNSYERIEMWMQKNWKKYRLSISSYIESFHVLIWNYSMQNNIDSRLTKNDDIKRSYKKTLKRTCTNALSSRMIAFFNKKLLSYWYRKKIKWNLNSRSIIISSTKNQMKIWWNSHNVFTIY